MSNEEYEVVSESNAEYTAEVVEELREIKQIEQYSFSVVLLVATAIFFKTCYNFISNFFN